MTIPDVAPDAHARRREILVWTALATALAAFDLAGHLFQQWISFDEGAMALAASLVRDGAWPHRDFADVYSGGLALFDAGAQALFGDDLRALRIPFGIAAILWVPLLAACFRRFVAPAPAAGLALLGFLWGPPIYTAPMPSWYLLFLATLAIWALFRWEETGRPVWWGLVGLCIGLGLAIKINALFLLAGAGCVLLTSPRHRAGVLGAVVVLLGVLGAWMTVQQGWPGVRALVLILPLLLLLVSLIAAFRREPATRTTEVRAVGLPLAWLLGGVAVVVVPWVIAYAATGGLAQLIDGTLVLPFRRTLWANRPPRMFGLPELFGAAAFLGVWYLRMSARAVQLVAVLIVCAAFYWTEASRLVPDENLFAGWRALLVWTVLGLSAVGVALLRTPPEEHPRLRIVGWIAAWFALLQYPFWVPNYLAYVAPILLLAAVAAARSTVPRPIGAALALGLGIWTLGVNHGIPLSELGHGYTTPLPRMARLDLPRGGLVIAKTEADGWTQLVGILDDWGARTIVAGPDTPEIYYLSGRPFTGRELFEFQRPGWSAASFAQHIKEMHPDALVLNTRPYFSKIPLDSLIAHLDRPIIADTLHGKFRMFRFAPDPE